VPGMALQQPRRGVQQERQEHAVGLGQIERPFQRALGGGMIAERVPGNRGSLSHIAGGDRTEQLKRLVAGNELPEDRPGGRYSRCLRPAVGAQLFAGQILAACYRSCLVRPPACRGKLATGGITVIGRRLLTRPAAMLACKRRKRARDADQIPRQRGPCTVQHNSACEREDR
jgi:hypothetical protein